MPSASHTQDPKHRMHAQKLDKNVWQALCLSLNVFELFPNYTTKNPARAI